jgi:hypothetical protein
VYVTTINLVIVNSFESYEVFYDTKIIHAMIVMTTHVMIGLKTIITRSMVNGVNYDATNDLSYDRDSDVKQQIIILNKINILL